MAKEIPQVLKGFRDYLPDTQIARKNIISKIESVFERFGFAPMDTPALEPYELLKGKIGEDEKLIYKFKDLGDREIALRYDLTLSLTRVVGSDPNLIKPFKRYQIANVWRAENTQRGRFREFMQCDVDIIGSKALVADAEVVATIASAFETLDIGEVVVKYNNRQIIDEVLGDEDKTIFLRTIDKMDKMGEDDVVELLKEQGIKISLDEYRSQMKDKGQVFISEFENYLKNFGVKNYVFEPTLARGLDYYTGTIFEFVLKDNPKFGSIAAGGRYDNLIGKISGKEESAVGGSIGLDRLFAALEESGKLPSVTSSEVIIFNLDEKLIPEYLKIASELRSAGINTEIYYDTAKLDKQFKYAERKNVKVAVIMGLEESKSDRVNLKDLQTKEQITVSISELINKVKSMMK
ncbi:MAG: histidine--tRNA ligase [Candidatus Doudnabacteria bacterium RIFCSPLOWO2_02_FULL_42_9]|uniref:Histidine--tRNA ligase n=1 Tax=Candidatus Doudnabacteria bacterium RIFCSPHIGHO2_01_FULL_41_86 TaxID=1817821 RepID=A0A1F5N9N3_9BACT|nr:MAG: histidine--tRNA ligase [Candidatus Doudnabacteria bacterium RIFCSPHIGHO2_01_FULL_41_86]OGE75620.1 MAG: histidine--tRNA ligase [Candidatus Doudnabacteria bacterium RIFCSPHIGHO2_01_43_10]OGE85415.1 MAG: histidine--tRNA ligase [Candidatus Doudnabacteria bacterium RIFCSPHIGHO2_12_FULL_42_22]OGE86953.1 MAG: histidine--tRNA ligase [Candidatus Doudnabacteria bacterium RIFCSPHIGHO2_02_FULL_42_25]OGE92552.1 MAG: histidine--tRNA ligase [Candidatus Doudnabacteria bacterium RIFCSPLOWO2_01_FULL_42_6